MSSSFWLSWVMWFFSSWERKNLGHRLSFWVKMILICEFAQLCKQLFLSHLEKNHRVVISKHLEFMKQNNKFSTLFLPALYWSKLNAILNMIITCTSPNFLFYFLIKSLLQAFIKMTLYLILINSCTFFICQRLRHLNNMTLGWPFYLQFR